MIGRNFSIVGNKKINPKEVYFPETLLNDENQVYFSTGELCLPIKLSSKMANDTINIFPSFGLGYYEVIIATLVLSSRSDLVEDKNDLLDNYYDDSDLHYLPEIRKRIYKLLKENLDSSYFELSLKYGLDFSRLYS